MAGKCSVKFQDNKHFKTDRTNSTGKQASKTHHVYVWKFILKVPNKQTDKLLKAYINM